ncbi:MAG TPA: flagellar basal body-associated FliL family protein [bacterium]|nr:flagellar basal body-associated FliL family protein [bacterium]
MTEVNEVNFSKGGRMAEGEGGGRGAGRLIRLAIIAVVALVLVGGGAFAGYWFLLRKPAVKATAGASAPAVGAAAVESSDLIENPQYLDVGSFTVNLAEGRRYLRISLTLLLNNPAAKAYLGTRQDDVKDLVLAELQTMTAEQLMDPRQRELLKQRILTKLQTLLPEPPKDWKDPMPIKKLLITEFLIQ